jgi:hypothetical protein
MRVIAENTAYAQHQAIIAGIGMLIAGALWFFTGRLKGFALAGVAILVLHPAWTISAVSGDCGYTKASAATIVSIIVGVCVVTQAALLVLWRSASVKRGFDVVQGGDAADS